jgi:hypothetical protein
MPEAASKGDAAKRAELMKQMLGDWNAALKRLESVLSSRDVERPLVLYGTDLMPDDRAPIPLGDLPAGAPPWWSSLSQWAERRAVGSFPDSAAETEAKRATIVVTVPTGERPWHGH